MPLAICTHPLERLRPFWGGTLDLDFGQRPVFIKTLLPFEDSPDRVPDRPRVLHGGLFRHLALRRGFEGEVERLRHKRSQIMLTIGQTQNELDPERSS